MDVTFCETRGTLSLDSVLAFPHGEREPDPDVKEFLERATQAFPFGDKRGKAKLLITPEGVPYGRVVLYGLGKEASKEAWREAGAAVVTTLRQGGEDVWAHIPDEDNALQFAFGALLMNYRFGAYKDLKKGESVVQRLSVVVPNAASATQAFERFRCVAEGVYLTRDLINEPGNVLDPETFSERMSSLAEMGVKVSVLGEKRLKELNMNLMLAVGLGSAKESKLVLLEWNGATPDSPRLALVGKGVTFDSGGLSLKSSGGMDLMKADMGGAAAIAGAICALAHRKAPVNVVAVLAMVENMPGGNATRPGDIVRSASGKTVKILNTDAEGRLILGDALWFCQKEFSPALMVDIATLTGGVVSALGSTYAGFFSRDEKLWDKFKTSSERSGERLWPLPLHPEYDEALDSSIADMQNIPKAGGRFPGASIGAHFLGRFVEEETLWAHLDIAGTSIFGGGSQGNGAFCEKGILSGYGVRLLEQFIHDHYES